MEIGGIVSAICVGVVIGLIGRMILSRRERVAAWIPVAFGVAAALLGSVLAHWVGLSDSGFGWPEVAFQLVLATGCVFLLANAGKRSVE
jgi:uncharacterized membrane protein YeaQ/YmgE (transglycosylase-associated protein family)